MKKFLQTPNSLDHCGNEKENDVVFSKHPIHWIHCGDEKEYDEVFQNTQFIGFIVVMK